VEIINEIKYPNKYMGVLFSKQSKQSKQSDEDLPVTRYEVLADGTKQPIIEPKQGICQPDIVASAYLWGII